MYGKRLSYARTYDVAFVDVSANLSVSPPRTGPARDWGDHRLRGVGFLDRAYQTPRVDGACVATRL